MTATKASVSPVGHGEALCAERSWWRVYSVFSADVIHGVPADDHPAAVELVPPADALPDRAGQFFDALPARVHHGGDRAYYDRHADAIYMPLLAQFSSRARWASTVAPATGMW